MGLIEVDYELKSADWSHEIHTRSEGLHLSTVIKSIGENQNSIFKGGDLDQSQLEAYRLGGFLFEHGLYSVIMKQRRLERLGEFELDKIWMTPDAVDLDTSTLIESKCTWRSMPTRKNKRDIEDNEEWVMQILGYLKALGLTKAELWVYFTNGGYGAERQPKLRVWKGEWSQAEIDENWRRINRHAQWMREVGKA